MIVQMKLRTGINPFLTLTNSWTDLDLSQLNVIQRYRLIGLINQYLVLIGCSTNECTNECINTRRLVIDYLK